MSDALAALLAGFGKHVYSQHVRDCAALGCQERVFGYALFCPECWRALSSDLQGLIAKYHRPGRKPTKVLTAWVQQAIDELAYVRLHGRRPPQPQSFMWDEPAPAPAVDEPLLFPAAAPRDDEPPR